MATRPLREDTVADCVVHTVPGVSTTSVSLSSHQVEIKEWRSRP